MQRITIILFSFISVCLNPYRCPFFRSLSEHLQLQRFPTVQTLNFNSLHRFYLLFLNTHFCLSADICIALIRKLGVMATLLLRLTFLPPRSINFPIPSHNTTERHYLVHNFAKSKFLHLTFNHFSVFVSRR